MQQQISKAFREYKSSILFASSIGKYQDDILAGRAVKILRTYTITKKRAQFIYAIEKVCSQKNFFVLDHKYISSIKRTRTPFLFENFTQHGHFLFFTPSRVKNIEVAGSLLNFNLKDFELIPFLAIQNIYSLPTKKELTSPN